jgi:hypothetical protein
MTGRKKEDPVVRLIVCMLPHSPSEKEKYGFPQLEQIPMPVSFEVRPVARLSTSHRSEVRPLVGGVSIGAGNSTYGTLGGIVKDQNGVRYGMTCAHVIPSKNQTQQPAIYDDRKAGSIGSSLADIALKQCNNIGPCNPYTTDDHISSVDTTLIELDSAIPSSFEILSIGPLAGVISKNSMTPGQEITFAGRTSGYRTAEVGGLGLFYKLHFKGQTYCYHDLFEVRWKDCYRTLFGPVVRAGDSGAWVCAETSGGTGWCGQIIGEDRRVGYASYAENIVTAWGNKGKFLCLA